MLISIVIPVFRNEQSLKLTYEALSAFMGEHHPAHELEFVFVNDGSDDDSLSILQELAAHDARVRVISLVRNFGQVAAVICGFRYCKGDVIVNMSADLQEPIEKISEMLSAYEKGNEIVICKRIGRKDSLVSRITSAFFYRLMNLSNKKIPPGGFDFLLLSRQAVDLFNSLDERNRFFQGDVLWLGLPTCYLPYKRLKREHGKSQWTLSKKIKYFIDGVINTSYFPIRLMSLLGLVFASGGFLYAIAIVINYFLGNSPFQGWSPIMILILVVGGLIMLMLGLIGEYLWRIYDEVRGRPVYLVDRRNSRLQDAEAQKEGTTSETKA